MRRSVNRWLTLCFAGIMALTLLVAVGWNYYSSRNAILDREENEIRNCMAIISDALDHYGADALTDRSREEAYSRIRYIAGGLCEGFQLELLLIAEVDPVEHVRTHVLTISSDGGTMREVTDAEESRILSEAASQEKMEAALQTEPGTVTRQVIRNRVIWYTPYLNQIGKKPEQMVICIQTSVGIESGLILRDFLMDILLPVAAVAVSFLLLLLLVRRRIIRPIRAVSDSMKRFAQDSRIKPEPLNIRSDDEIGEIAGSFEKMTEDISAYVNSIEDLTRERLQDKVQLDVARRIQNGLVPEQSALKGTGYRVQAMTRPAKAVGGDFYDCFRREDGSVCVFMGDVSGKGISAAIFMAVAKTTIREKLLAGLSPAEALNRANDELVAQNPEGLFATVFAAELNPHTGGLCYANAGHTLPLLLKDAPEYLHPDSGIALGLFEDAQIRNENLCMAPGEGILLYTDGITEAVNPSDSFFGTERLLEAVRARPEEGADSDVLMCVSRAIAAFCDGCEPFDDMAVLVLYRDNAAHTLPVALSSFDEIKRIVFEAAGNTPGTRMALLACDEVLVNIVSYSGAKSLSFSCEKENEKLYLRFSDDGTPFDPTAAEPKEKPFEELDEGGMGLNMIRQSASDMRYERKDGRNELTLVFKEGE